MLRNRFVRPDVPIVDQHIGEASGNVDEWIAIGVARFDQCDRCIGVFGKVTRDDAAGCARSDDDDIVGFLDIRSFSFASFESVQSTRRGWSSIDRCRMLRLMAPSHGKMTLRRERGKSSLVMESINGRYRTAPRGAMDIENCHELSRLEATSSLP